MRKEALPRRLFAVAKEHQISPFRKNRGELNTRPGKQRLPVPVQVVADSGASLGDILGAALKEAQTAKAAKEPKAEKAEKAPKAEKADKAEKEPKAAKEDKPKKKK